eukprot:4321242-Pyramimonas_sp.AAC.1
MKRFISKAVDNILVWQDMGRDASNQADLAPLARFLGEALSCYAKMGSCDNVHALLPYWMVGIIRRSGQ